MSSEFKISLRSAIIINLNIMLGTGIFLNSIPLAQYAAAACFLPYIITGILFIPLIISMATLLSYENGGGTFYDISKNQLGQLFGFISCWSYFIAKPASAGLMIHFFNYLMQQLFPVLQNYSIYGRDLFIIGLFAILNLLNMKIGRSIQFAFVNIKIIPIFFIIIAGIWYFNPLNFALSNFNFSGIPIGLPLALFACSGFEASLSLSQHIKDAQKNAPKAIIISYAIAIFIYIFYQISYFAAINISMLSQITSFNAISFFIFSIFKQNHATLQALLYICMCISALGGAYGIIFSNTWNLHRLAQNNHTFLSKRLLTKNHSGIAFWCLFAEIILCTAYILFTQGNQITMQYISVFGSTIAYTISVVAFTALAFKVIKSKWSHFIACLAIINCGIFLTACINGFIHHGPTALYVFIGMLAAGLMMFALTKKI